jgi:hypothetical protein
MTEATSWKPGSLPVFEDDAEGDSFRSLKESRVVQLKPCAGQ